MKIFAAHNPDSEIRYQSSAGGVFSMLANKILSEGGVVYGVGFDNDWDIVHRRIDNPEDLRFLRGSKYAYSRIGTAIQDAISDLKSGKKVLFSGTPCQAAAMRKAGGDNPNLLIVEVVCHGAPEHKYWERYLEELCQSLDKKRSEISSVNFRDKRTGWKNYSFTIKFSDASEFSEPHGNNLYMRAFLNNLTLRESCFRCPFKYPKGSKADITIGDFWKLETVASDLANDTGTCLVIMKTEKGLEYDQLINKKAEFSFETVKPTNKAICQAASISRKYDVFKAKISDGCNFISIVARLTKEPLSLRAKILIINTGSAIKKIILGKIHNRIIR